MIIIKCVGGLGNQMFLYALYKNFIKKNIEVCFDINDYKNYNLHNGYELDSIFNLEIKYAENEDVKRLKVNKKQYIKKFIRRINPDLISHKILHPYLYNEEIFSLSNAYLEGYGQNIKYIKFVEKELREDFQYKVDSLDNINKKYIEKIKKDKNSVSIHIRRGDYIDNAEAYKIYGGICENEYFHEAVKKIREKIENPNFYVFSNDIEWVKRNLKLNNATYINHNNGADSYKDLILMSNCKHNIIANSTFSWWGAWLNSNVDKIVIMPNMWTNYQKNVLNYKGCILI